MDPWYLQVQITFEVLLPLKQANSKKGFDFQVAWCSLHFEEKVRSVLVKPTSQRDTRELVLTWLEGFDGHWSRVVPQTFVHFSELTVSNFLDKFERTLRNLPLVLRVVRQPNCLWFLNLATDTG